MSNNVATGIVFVVFLSMLIVPLSLFAHETHIYEIGGVEYEIVVGSRGEPVIVDDKTGLDLEIVRDGELFLGAQDALKVEMIAGEKTRIDAIEPVFGSEGKYKTNFIATVPTTIQYRLFGELEGVSFDQTYTCNPVGHPASTEDTTHIEVSEGVVQTLSRGNFGCPQPKEEFGFPELALSGNSISKAVAEIQNEADREATVVEEEEGLEVMSIATFALAVLAVMLGLLALLRKPKTTFSA